MNNQKHLFFDLDHTLWDFETNSRNALSQLFVELKLDMHLPSFEEFHHRYKVENASLWKQYGRGDVTKDYLRYARFRDTFTAFGIENEQLVYQISDGYVSVSPYQTAVFPHTHEILDHFKREGYILHIITNGFSEIQHIKLQNSQLIDFFDVIICSEAAGANKPSPIIFDYAIKQAKAKAINSIMIGDNYEADVQGALRFGFKNAVLFDPDNKANVQVDEHRITRLKELEELVPFLF